jgi:predicted DNA-binding transcriptional regulator AlpA
LSPFDEVAHVLHVPVEIQTLTWSSMMDGNNREILNEREVADWLGLSEPTLFRHRRDGTGPKFIQLSTRRVAYRRSAIEEWLKERERQSLRSSLGTANGPSAG